MVKHLKKKIKEQGKKQVEPLTPITQKLRIKEAKNELIKIKDIERTVDKEKLYYKTITYAIIFRVFEQKALLHK